MNLVYKRLRLISVSQNFLTALQVHTPSVFPKTKKIGAFVKSRKEKRFFNYFATKNNID